MITCFLLVDNCFEAFTLPQSFIEPLVVALREKGYETVHTEERSVKATGIYVPAKDSHTRMMLLSEEDC